VRALYDYTGEDDAQLSFKQGDIIEVLTRSDTGWWDGCMIRTDERAWFPSSHCVKITEGETGLVSGLKDASAPRSRSKSKEAVHDENAIPSKLRVKVIDSEEGTFMSLLVRLDTTFQELQIKISAELNRRGTGLADGSAKLDYIHDGELVPIRTDEDVQFAFDTLRAQSEGPLSSGELEEIVLFCRRS